LNIYNVFDGIIVILFFQKVGKDIDYGTFSEGNPRKSIYYL